MSSNRGRRRQREESYSETFARAAAELAAAEGRKSSRRKRRTLSVLSNAIQAAASVVQAAAAVAAMADDDDDSPPTVPIAAATAASPGTVPTAPMWGASDSDSDSDSGRRRPPTGDEYDPAAARAAGDALPYLNNLQVPFVKALELHNVFILDEAASRRQGHPVYKFSYQNFLGARDSPGNLIHQEWQSMLNPRQTGSDAKRCYLTPSGTLAIPLYDVYNLRVSMMIYLLSKMCEEIERLHNRGRFTMYRHFSNFYPRNVNNGMILGGFRCGHIMLDEIVDCFNELDQHFQNAYDDAPGRLINSSNAKTWTNAHTYTVNSGERVMIRLANKGRQALYYLQIFSMEMLQLRIGGMWCKDIEELMPYLADAGVMTSKNDDNMCFFYCLAMGILSKEHPESFPLRDVIFTPGEICAKIMLNYKEDDPAYKIYKITTPPVDDKWERKLQDDFSLQEFRDFMRNTESTLIPDSSNLALDVYLMNTTRSLRVYPGYMSNREVESGKRISLLMVITKNVCHTFLIKNLERLFKRTGGKIFFTCGRCKQSFYTRSLLSNHKCTNASTSEFHPASSEYEIDRDCVGRCERCFLIFQDEWKYQYHMEHCLMTKHAGYRHVKLVPHHKAELTYEDPSKDTQMGKSTLLFADFECCVAPEGEEDEIFSHHFMSYGLLSNLGKDDIPKFTIGYDLGEFMEALDEEALKHKRTVVYFHNAMNYDAFFIIRYFLEHHDEDRWSKWSMRVLMKTSSALQSVSFMCNKPGTKTKCTLVIGDTCKFLTMSLDKIVSSVRKATLEENREVFPLFFRLFHEKYPSVSPHDIMGILQKNLFPYNFFDAPEKLDTSIIFFDEIFLPREENLKYFSETVSVEALEKNYEDFKHVCSAFEVNEARDYHDIYLMCDVLQIADVFLHARASLRNTHNIDLAEYIGMPSASWHAFLRSNPDLRIRLYDSTFYAEFFQSMTRGGVTSAPLRYAKRGNGWNIAYFDVNGLYPTVMQAYPYPMGDFSLRKMDTPDDTDVSSYCLSCIRSLELSGKGACFCVDLIIPPSIQEMTDEFPFAPTHELIHDEYFDENGQMYEFMQNWSDANGGAIPPAFKGLVGTLNPKKQYGVHWRLLRFYLEHGAIVTKIHFIVTFTEGFYMRDYIAKNIEIRNTRSDALGKMVYKLLGNSIYGKTFESPFNHGSYTIVDSREKLGGMIEEGNIRSFTQINAKYTIVGVDGQDTPLDKPTYIGACVTELAKLHMYELFYDKLRPAFNGDLHLVYTDTDSFIVMMKHPDPINFLKSTAINGEILIGSEGGKIKSETGDELIDEVVALRSKVYAYKLTDGHIGKRAKGTTAAAQEMQLDWNTYVQALQGLKGIPTGNMQFVRDRFTVRTMKIEKLSLSANDGKRYICADGIHTYAWGNPKIEELKHHHAEERKKREQQEKHF